MDYEMCFQAKAGFRVKLMHVLCLKCFAMHVHDYTSVNRDKFVTRFMHFIFVHYTLLSDDSIK